MFTPNRMRQLLLPLLLGGLGLLSACSTVPSSQRLLQTVSPYRFDRMQGNVVTREQVNALKPGMPRTLVRDILGTPLLVSVFHADRWDYVFFLLRQGAEPQARHVSVYFKGDQLDRFEADDLPTEAEFVATLKSQAPAGQGPVLEASAESLQKFPPPAKAAAPLPAPAPAATAYPPLEPANP